MSDNRPTEPWIDDYDDEHKDFQCLACHEYLSQHYAICPMCKQSGTVEYRWKE